MLTDLKNIENYKIYSLIIASIVAFVILAFESFSYVSSELENLSKQNRNLIIQEIRYLTKSWLRECIDVLELTAYQIDENYANEEQIKKISQTYSQYDKYFDALQILVADDYFYVNGIKVDDYKKHIRYQNNLCNFSNKNSQNTEFIKTCSNNTEKIIYKTFEEEHWYLGTKWFQDTKNTMKTNMETMKVHGLLFEKTINLCTPIKDDKKNFKGVFCGIIKVDLVPQKIETLKIPKNYYYFISDKEGNILIAVGNYELINKNAKEIFSKKSIKSVSSAQDIVVGNSVVTIDNLIDFNWYIGVGADEEEANSYAMRKFFKHSAIIFGCFVIFVIIINSSYTFLYKRSEAKRVEYEKILQYRSKMSEIGELISAVNHQIRQPINALALLINNAINKLCSKDSLDKKELEQNLRLSQKDILLINNTIDIFRNFYSFNDTVTEFELKNCVENVLCVMRTELSISSIKIDMDASNIEGVKIYSIENFVQQILLVLIQNAKDAILPLKVIRELQRRKIEITFKIDKKFAHIFVSDFGMGVAEDAQNKLFSGLKGSKKHKGTGIGLFFSKKLAKERLMGDLTLISSKMPTTFKLTLARDIKRISHV
ncbi:MAG: sensor histidine kinase [Campylobacteraceae bacterium]|jgi:nitrogen-specific signal transduction histidine kinase|nr:sensor histidine kinase [Campylobacteraceae bacterium]